MTTDIIWLRSTDSTNEEARRRISDIDNLSVLSATEQTEGRGQRGNTWISPPGENLTFSIVLKFQGPASDTEGCRKLPRLNACRQFILTEITSVSMLEFLSRYGIHSSVKWPNDIYIGSRKVCGMLIENSLRGNLIMSSIIGIGLNINQRNFDVTLSNPTSMVIESGMKQLDTHICLVEFLEIFTENLERYLADADKLSDELRERYTNNLWRLDTPSTFISHAESGRIFSGKIQGVSPCGLLIIEDMEKGELKEFAFKEIGYIF